MAEEEDRIHVAKTRSAARGLSRRHLRTAGDDVRVRSDVSVVDPRLVAKLLNHCHGMTNVVLGDAVPGVRPDQDVLLHRALNSVRRALRPYRVARRTVGRTRRWPTRSKCAARTRCGAPNIRGTGRLGCGENLGRKNDCKQRDTASGVRQRTPSRTDCAAEHKSVTVGDLSMPHFARMRVNRTGTVIPVSYTHLRAHETRHDL